MGDTVLTDIDEALAAFNAQVEIEQQRLLTRQALERGEKTAARLRLAERLAEECETDPLTAYNTLVDCKWNERKARKRLEQEHGQRLAVVCGEGWG